MSAPFPAGWARREAERIVRQVAAERSAGIRVPAYVPQPDVTRVDLPALTAAPQAPPAPYADISAAWVRKITYPAPGQPARRYAATLRAISKATGTTSRYQEDAAWPALTLETGATA